MSIYNYIKYPPKIVCIIFKSIIYKANKTTKPLYICCTTFIIKANKGCCINNPYMLHFKNLHI